MRHVGCHKIFNFRDFLTLIFNITKTLFIMKKKFLSAVALVMASGSGFAQTVQDGSAAIEQATTDVVALYDIVAQLIFAIAAIIALVGAIKIFMAWNSGERDVSKMVIGWFGACIFLVAIGTIITAFFGQ